MIARQIDASYEHTAVVGGGDSVERAFDELTRVIEAMDMPGSLSDLYRVLGRPDVPTDKRVA